MKFNLSTIQPRHDFNRLLLNAKSIKIDGFDGEVEITNDGLGNLTVDTIAGIQDAFVAEPKKRGRRKS